MQETAYAKINLALHVRRQREDGYHELETLFAFVDAGDVLVAELAAEDSLCVVGEFAGSLHQAPLPSGEGLGVRGLPSIQGTATPPPPSLPPGSEAGPQGQRGKGFVFDNIVAKALAALPRPNGLAITLEKTLPVAAGLGGGSADAGAVFRLVERMHGLPDDWPARAARLGADVPACVESRTCIGRGTGIALEPGPQDLAGTPVLLVNPRVPLATGPVFKAWDGIDRGPMPEGTAREIALAGRNDLEPPALGLCRVIGEVLAALLATAPLLARMSGSGATCFAFYASEAERDAAALAMPAAWWRMAGRLR